MKEKILQLFDGVYLACIWMAGLAMAEMRMIVPRGVFARYVLGTGPNWPEPVAVLLMTIGMPVAYALGMAALVGARWMA